MTDSDTIEEDSERPENEGSERPEAETDEEGDAGPDDEGRDGRDDEGRDGRDAPSGGAADEAGAKPDGDRPRGDGAGRTDVPSGTAADRMSSVRKILYWTLLGGLVLFGGMMVLLVYSDFRTLINVFVAREYQLLIQVAFHLVVLLCAAIGVSLVVRRLEELPG